ncbi:MAG TPA: nitrogenase component 1 [Chitinivibrionales bacterium]
MSNFIEKPRYACALGGALATVNALPRSVAILHASLGCGGMTSAALNGASGYLGSGYCGGNSIPVSGITEKEVVFGGAERLEEQIKNTVSIIDADLFVVITGCTAEIIGDDVASIVRTYNENRVDTPPILFASGAGFKGDSLYGYDSVLQSLFRDFLEPAKTRKKGVVNIWGIPPGQDVFWEGNLLEIRRILEALGLSVNTFFTSSDDLDDIKAAAQAQLNIVLSPVYGINAAETFKEVHGTPYISLDLPIGAKAAEEFIVAVVNELGLDVKKSAAVASKESTEYYRFFNRIIDAYSDIDLQRYTVIVGDANYAVNLTKFVKNELGWIPTLVAVTDQVSEEQNLDVFNRFGDVLDNPEQTVVFETDTSLISDLLYQRWPRPDGSRFYRAFSPAFVIGSRLDKDFADSIGAGHLAVSYPVSNRVVLNRGYAGYHGGLHLVEDIYTSILSGR